jgi:iron(III) transport system substrate-binding protein
LGNTCVILLVANASQVWQMTCMKNYILMTAFAALALSACSPSDTPVATDSVEADTPMKTLTIYSARHYDSDRDLYAAYEAKAGIKIDVREAKSDQLLETMKAEGANSPADLIIAADAGALWRFQDAGLTQGVSDARLEAAIPSNFREADGHWYGVGKRVRLVAYDPSVVDVADVDDWADLASPDLKGEICVRSSSNIYNLSLMAEMISRVGPEAAGEWAKGVRENMARDPQGGDTDQIRAVAAGECSVAIVNHYYWVRLAQSGSESDRATAEATRLVIPSFGDGGGAHVNITGVAISASADDTALAADFIAYLVSPEGQSQLMLETKELPMTAGAAMPEGTEAVPAFEISATPLQVLGENQAEAQRLYDLAGWN